MRSVVGMICILIGILTVEAQRPQYAISATLDTSSNTLTGHITITYTNNSYRTLDSLGLHLWPNAYSTRASALVKQRLNQGDLSLYRTKTKDQGNITGLDFSAADQDIQLYIDSTIIDVGWIVLSKPLKPAEAITLSSPFKLKIPKSLSRLGHSAGTYQISQWYPHVAVYDEDGWHTMPYLELGEYYNDFADYTVELELPNGYEVAATGIISEINESDSSATWIIEAENVIDMAWFASPTFQKETFRIDVGGKEEVEVNIYVEELDSDVWDRAPEYAARALKLYSDWLGPYPYPQMSIVSAPLGVAGGMEYPMLSHIGVVSEPIELDALIAHEIGHTWLYGILANNERQHAWLDEGLNSFIEAQYLATYYPDFIEFDVPGVFRASDAMKPLAVVQRYFQFNNSLEPPISDPQYQDKVQYFFSAYELPTQGLKLMMEQVGRDNMQMMFRDYYHDYKFSHVTPEILRQSFEKSCDCDLTWFFEDWLLYAHDLDYRIKKFKASKKEITLINKGASKAPLKINTYKDGEVLKTHWVKGFSGEKTIHLDTKADAVKLYEGNMAVNRNYTTNVSPRSILPRIRLLPQVESYDRPTIGVTPIFGYNLADGFMPGVAFTSGLFPQNKFKFVIAPMYGLGSKKFRGFGTLRYIGDFKEGAFDKYLLSFGFDNFGYNLDTHYLYRDNYVKWSPSVALRFRPNKSNHIVQWLKYRFVHIDQHYNTGIDYEEKLYDKEKRNYGVHELEYQIRSDYVLRPYEFRTNIQAGDDFLRVNLFYKQHFRGKTKNHGVWLTGFAGFLPVYDVPEANVQFTVNGTASNGYFSKDYMFDEWLGGRNAYSGIFAQQIFKKDAGLKTLSTIGIGNEWMIGTGISVALPFRFVHLYMDAAFYDSAITEEAALTYSGGASIVLWKDVFEVYFPFLESKDIRESLSYVVKDQWFERISFQANIKLANPVNLLDRNQLAY